MSANPVLWWEERLKARFPVSDVFKQEPYNYKAQEGTNADPWPIRVARQALYLDYLCWVDINNVEAWKDEKDYTKPVKELLFFSTLAPFLYINGKERMVKNYNVRKCTPFEGNYVYTKVRRYFVRLGTYDEHVSAFRRETGRLEWGRDVPASQGSASHT